MYLSIGVFAIVSSKSGKVFVWSNDNGELLPLPSAQPFDVSSSGFHCISNDGNKIVSVVDQKINCFFSESSQDRMTSGLALSRLFSLFYLLIKAGSPECFRSISLVFIRLWWRSIASVFVVSGYSFWSCLFYIFTTFIMALTLKFTHCFRHRLIQPLAFLLRYYFSIKAKWL